MLAALFSCDAAHLVSLEIMCNQPTTLFDTIVMVTGGTVFWSLLGINDEQRVVRNAALFTVGQFSEHLQVSPAFYQQ